jgi:O-antigen/teichoic acid export membrane protein/streptogramin lyase
VSSALSRLTSRGAVVNLAFGSGTQLMAAVQAVFVARLLGPKILGLYALASGGVAIGATLKDLGIARKMVQEREVDLYTAYNVAFSLELVMAGAVLTLVSVGVAPLIAIIYHRPELFAVTAVLSLSIFTTAFLQLPASLPYREMRFVRRNVVLAVAPVVEFAVTVAAALSHLGIWALVAGDLSGLVATGMVLAFTGPIRPRLMWDRALVRRYVSFGTPLWLAGIIGTAAGWGAALAVSSAIGVAALGFFDLAQGWAQQAVQVDRYLADTLFPALCSIQSSMERQRRAFVISARLSMGWAAPVGVAMFAFAEPVVRMFLGRRWLPAVILVQAEGAGVLITGIGYSWSMFFAARGKTRPQLVVAGLGGAWLLGIALPSIIFLGLRGAALAILALAVGSYAIRSHYLESLFGPMRLITMVWRELAAALGGGAVVLAMRAAGWRVHGVADLIGQTLIFGVVSASAFVLLERPLMTEVFRSLRPARTPSSPAVVGSGAPTSPGTIRAQQPPTISAGRPMSFPLGMEADPDGIHMWVTTRDWPALGRLDLRTRRWHWTEMDAFPHWPTPDGHGGCWAALTRQSALVHLGADGLLTTVPLARSKELLVTTRCAGAVWVVDADPKRLWRVDEESLETATIELPEVMRRPDVVCVGPDGRLWVADTHSPALAAVTVSERTSVLVAGPHPTRAVVCDRARGGLWLGSSTEPQLTLLDPCGEVALAIDLAGVPFGVRLLADGRLVATLKDNDALALVDPDSGTVETIALPESSTPTACAAIAGGVAVAMAGPSELLAVALPERPTRAIGTARPQLRPVGI